MREQLLDAFDIEAAILTSLFFVGDMRVQKEFGNAIATAYNEWVFEKWLSAEPRLRGSIAVNATDPPAAAAEIDRVAQRPGYVQVILGPSRSRLWREGVRSDLCRREPSTAWPWRSIRPPGRRPRSDIRSTWRSGGCLGRRSSVSVSWSA